MTASRTSLENCVNRIIAEVVADHREALLSKQVCPDELAGLIMIRGYGRFAQINAAYDADQTADMNVLGRLISKGVTAEMNRIS